MIAAIRRTVVLKVSRSIPLCIAAALTAASIWFLVFTRLAFS